MKNPFKKPKDEVAKKRKEQAKKPYKKCGHRRSYTAKGGSTITVICQKNANVKHKHD
jgi:hypothetical protein